MKIIKRLGLIFFVLVILISCLPLSVFAVDPMSSAMIANAFAQAIASYGASQGAGMTFDVTSTDNIGSGVHELWEQFREASQDSDDFAYYANLFINTNPFSLVSVAGSAGYVAVTIDESIKPALDDFWNWLFSGPAEMVKVDDQYYEWSSAQIGDNAVPIELYSSSPWYDQPLPLWSQPLTYAYVTYSGTVHPLYVGYRDNYGLGSIPVYGFFVDNSTYYIYYAVTPSSSYSSYDAPIRRPVSYSSPSNATLQFAYTDSVTGLIYSHEQQIYPSAAGYSNFVLLNTVPVFSSLRDGLDSIAASLDGSIISDSIGVKAYGDSTTAEFPDTTDPNYDALHPPIPLNIPWDQTAYGDGTGTLTDAQTQAIVSDLVGALEQDGTVELAETTNPPVTPDFQDVILPLIPISLPSFNFSLSGIWHYVRDWVNSLGAWLSLLFTTWSYLPYAISVPVYASLVVVIVLGLYRRFFM